MDKNKKEHQIIQRYFFFMTVVSLVLLIPCVVFADTTTDPLTTINNLSTFVFSAIKAIGVALLVVSILNFRTKKISYPH